jgi:hypothetical protein
MGQSAPGGGEHKGTPRSLNLIASGLGLVPGGLNLLSHGINTGKQAIITKQNKLLPERL